MKSYNAVCLKCIIGVSDYEVVNEFYDLKGKWASLKLGCNTAQLTCLPHICRFMYISLGKDILFQIGNFVKTMIETIDHVFEIIFEHLNSLLEIAIGPDVDLF